MIPKKQKGTHTWDLYVHYHSCPECGAIIESRDDYEYQLGKYIKHLDCHRCGHSFTETKPSGKQIGPIFGEPPKPEFDWD